MMGFTSTSGAEPAEALERVSAVVLLAGIARVVRQQLERTLTPLHLRPRHLVALSYLDGHGPTAQRLLAGRLCMDPSSMVGLLNELEDAGLVIRERDRRDRRCALLRLSPAGEAALRRVDQELDALEARLLVDLDSSERADLRGLLTRVSVAAGATCEP